MALFNHILVPTDFSGPSKEALRVAVDLATTFGAALTLLHVHDLPTYVYYGAEVDATLLGALESDARRGLDETATEATQRVSRTQAVFRIGSARSEIVSLIEAQRPDLVVMGTHGRHGVGHALLGSVAEAVVRLSPVPVLTTREWAAPAAGAQSADKPLRIAHVAASVEFDGSSDRALDLAESLAKAFAARLTLLHVAELPEYVHHVPSLAAIADAVAPIERAALQKLEALLPPRTDIADSRALVRGGAPVREILGFIEEQAPDLLVMGTHGRRGPERWRLGSVAQRIVQAAKVPVLTLKPSA